MKNYKELLIDATKLPAAIEAKLPAFLPKISTMLVDVAGKLPKLPDFPMDIPALPAIPAMPGMPAALTRYVREATVVETRPAPTPSRRGLVSFVYE